MFWWFKSTSKKKDHLIEVQISTQEFLKVAKKHSITSLTEAEFQINNLVNNYHTASPPTTGKLTENEIINI